MFCPRCTCMSSSTVRVCHRQLYVCVLLFCRRCFRRNVAAAVAATASHAPSQPKLFYLVILENIKTNKQINTLNQMSCSSNSADHIVIVKMTNLSTSLSIRGGRKGKQNTNVSEVRIEFSVLKATPLSQLGQSQRQCGEIDSSQFCRFIMSPRLYY